MRGRALFLDRDGVINVDTGYVHRPEQVQFVDGIFDVIAAANRAGFRVIVATNQSGIGRGLYTEEQFHALSKWMIEQCAEQGALIDRFYFCPFHPDHGVGRYRRASACRKPEPGMLLQAQREHDIDLSRSVLVGDRPTDIEAGLRAGVGTLLFFAPHGSVAGATTVGALAEVLPYLRAESI